MNRESSDRAREKFRAIVRAAAKGEPTTITFHGRPLAEVVPVGTWERAQGLVIGPGTGDALVIGTSAEPFTLGVHDGWLVATEQAERLVLVEDRE